MSASQILANGSLTYDRRLDCLPEFDPRSLRFLTRNLLEPNAPIRDTEHALDIRLDQGREGACVGFGFAHEAAAAPMVIKAVTDEMARLLYHRAQDMDEWPGNRYEGTSVNAGAKAAREAGIIDSWFWAKSAEELGQAISHLGPGVSGTNWTDGMENTDVNGFVHPTGRVRGGHCYIQRMVKLGKFKDGSEFAIGGTNSWGRGWGKDGNFWITSKAMDILIEQNGAICIPLSRGDTVHWPEPRRKRWLDIIFRKKN